MSSRPLAQGHRELMAQHQDLGVLPPRLPPRQAQHRHGPGDDEEDQLQAHKPKIIARQPEPDRPPGTPSRDRADGVPQSICPGGASFRHPQVLAVAGVVSPSTVSMDRAIKPVMYAEAGIPVYWRGELHDTPRIVACSLSRGRYVTRTTLVAGTPGRITRPFAVELDPADLTRRTA